jgi:DNA topoisomerase I
MTNIDKNFLKIKKTKKNFKGITKKLTVKDLNRLKSIYIPPAYKTIYLSRNTVNKVQLIAEDDKGRNQYFYNHEYISNSDKRKYNALRSFVSVAEKIEKDNQKQINRIYKQSNKTSKTKESINYDDYIHIIIWLLINNNFRIGNIKYDKLYNSNGITTLKPAHFTFKNSNCIISFIGKKGVENNAVITDNKIINIIKKLKLKYGKHNNIEYIFANNNGSLVKSKNISDYFKNKFGVKITPKMFRTYYANYHMLNFLQNKINLTDKNCKYTTLKTDKQKSSYLKTIIGDYVSNRLHNTPTVCRNKYINNKLLSKVIYNPHYYSNLNNKSNNIHSQLKRFIG